MHAIFHVVLAAFAHSEENKKENIFLFKFNFCLYAIEKYRTLCSQKTKSKVSVDQADF